MGAGETFDPSVTDNSADSYWRMPDNVVRTGQSQSIIGSSAGFDGTDKTIRYHATDFTEVASLDFIDDKVINVLDLSLLTIATDIRFNTNLGITSFVAAASTANIAFLYGQGCGINTHVNLVPLANLGGDIRFEDNNIPSISFPPSSQMR